MMTTQFQQYMQKGCSITFLCVLAVIAIVPESVYSATSTSEIVEEAVMLATTTNEIAVVPDEIAPETTLEPIDWFTTEQLIGNVEIGDFVVGPGRTTLELRPGETVTIDLSVSNRISNKRVFNLVVEDIAGSDDPQQGIRTLGDTIGPYSIRDYVSFPADSFELNLGERAKIPVTISIPPDAEPGGYYGAVFVTTNRTDQAEGRTNAAQSPVIARIASQFFITIPGQVDRSSVLRDVSLVSDQWWYDRGPIELAVTAENTGNIHLVMGADMVIKNLFGQEVGLVEAEPWYVLPRSVRLRTMTWDREFLLGRYVAEVRVARGHDDLIDTTSVAFWVLPWRIVGGGFVIIFLIIFAIRSFFRTFEFKRK